MTECPNDQRVVLITGAGSGIGAATASLLAAAGWRVALCGRRRSELANVADESGGLIIPADLSQPSACRLAVERTIESFGRLDGLVLNAGINAVGTAEETELADWERTLRVNLTAPFLMAGSAMPALRAAGGAIVTVASIGGLRAAPRSVAYATSKAGLVMLTKVLALDHGPENVRVNCVCPGWTRTEMSDAEMREVAKTRGTSLDEAYRQATTLVPQRRPAVAAEIGEAIAWLLSPAASYVTGATVVVDGGTSIVDPGAMIFAADAPIG